MQDDKTAGAVLTPISVHVRALAFPNPRLFGTSQWGHLGARKRPLGPPSKSRTSHCWLGYQGAGLAS